MLTVVARSSGPYREKPAEFVRGQSCRLPWAWDGLCFGVPLHEAGREGLRDVVNNAAPSAVVGGTWTLDNRSNPALTLNTSSWIDYADHPRHDQPSSALTVYVRLKKAGTPTAWGGAFSNVYSPASVDPWNSWTIGDAGAADGKMSAAIAETAGVMTTPDSAIITSTEYLSIFLRWNALPGTAGTADLRILGERGQIVQQVTSAAFGSGTIRYAAGQGIRINGNETPTPASFNAHYSQAMVWKRRLSNIELQALVSDPFGWYSPRREAVTVAAPFPVGPGMAAMPMTIGGSGRR